MEKKKWVQPELIVLVRRKLEEGVLQICKGYDQGGADDEFNGCWVVISCWSCEIYAES